MEQSVEGIGMVEGTGSAWSALAPRRAQTRRPRQGDVVVEPHGRYPVTFRIRTAPTRGTMMVTTPVRNTAIALARRFAAADHVNLWYQEEGRYRLLEVYRPDREADASLCVGAAGAR